jgi:anti-anti-sigma factor
MQANGFHVRLDRDGDAWSIRCGGELDLASSGRFAEAVELCLAAKPASVAVDCRDVCFIDSEGIRSLLHAARDAHDLQIGYRLEISEQVRESLARAGILERLLMGSER